VSEQPRERLVVGSVWVDKRPTAIAESLWSTNRRLFQVTDPGSEWTTGSRVMGVSFWEEKIAGEWIAADLPGNRRRVGVLYRNFLRRFEYVRGPALPTFTSWPGSI
jgi:hypothetical protein